MYMMCLKYNTFHKKGVVVGGAPMMHVVHVVALQKHRNNLLVELIIIEKIEGTAKIDNSK